MVFSVLLQYSEFYSSMISQVLDAQERAWKTQQRECRRGCREGQKEETEGRTGGQSGSPGDPTWSNSNANLSKDDLWCHSPPGCGRFPPTLPCLLLPNLPAEAWTPGASTAGPWQLSGQHSSLCLSSDLVQKALPCSVSLLLLHFLSQRDSAPGHPV